MKDNLLRRILVLLLACLIPLAGLADIPKPKKASKRFIIAVHEWPPFSGRDARYFGLLPRITTRIFDAQGIEVEYRFLPWADALDGLITEEYDAALVWVMSDLKSDAFLLSNPILKYRSGLYYLKGFPEPTQHDDLLGFRMGLNPNHVYDADTYQLLKSQEIVPIEGASDRENFLNLLNGGIDLYLAPVVTSKYVLQQYFTLEQRDKLDYTSNLLKFPPSHLLVNRYRFGTDDIIDGFNNGLKRLKNDGTLDRYIDDLYLEKY